MYVRECVHSIMGGYRDERVEPGGVREWAILLYTRCQRIERERGGDGPLSRWRTHTHQCPVLQDSQLERRAIIDRKKSLFIAAAAAAVAH